MNDDLRPAKGCAVGLVAAGLLWIVIFGGAAIVVARCAA